MHKVHIIGSKFEHRHWLNPMDNKPLVCIITKCARGAIYYRPYYGEHDDGTPWLGAPAYFDNAQFDKYVKKMLPE